MHLEEIQPELSYAELIMEWRNDPTTLQMSYHSKPKEMPDFFDEYLKDYFNDKECPSVIAIDNGHPVAFIRFNRYTDFPEANRRIVEIGINVKPSMRKKGLGTKILLTSLEYLRNKDMDGVVAEIKKENSASLLFFKQAGFSFYDNQKKYIPEINKVFEIVRFFFDLQKT